MKQNDGCFSFIRLVSDLLSTSLEFSMELNGIFFLVTDDEKVARVFFVAAAGGLVFRLEKLQLQVRHLKDTLPLQSSNTRCFY